jgi:hypothetical protein
MSAIVAKRVAAHLGRSGFVVMKKTPIGGSRPAQSRQYCAGSQINASIHKAIAEC